MPVQHLRSFGKSGAKLRAVDPDGVSLEFVKTELETGITFARIALSAKHADKLERNKANARLAYDTALRFAERLTPKQAADVDALIKDLRGKLEELGESL